MATRFKLFGLLLGAFLLLGGASAARAHDWDGGCSRRLHNERRELRHAIHRFGFFSPQAQEERSEVARLERRCGDRDDWGWFRGDGDRDRDDWRWRRGDGDHDRDDRGHGWHRGWNKHDRDDRDHDRNGDRD